jgi:hypothetical protein
MTAMDPLQEAIARHDREIAALKLELAAIKDGHVKKQLEDEIAQRIAALEADIKLQELQEAIDKEQAEQAEKQRKRGWFRW